MKSVLTGLIVGAAAFVPLAASAQTYTLTDLGAVNDSNGHDTQSVPTGLNASGQACGISSNPSAGLATLFSNGSAIDLGFLDSVGGDDLAFAYAINRSGSVAGKAGADGGLQFHAFVDSGGHMTDINSSSLFPAGSAAFGLNATGQAVGVGYLTSSNFHAFLYSNGKTTDIGPPGAYQAGAVGINDSGQIIGSYYDTSGASGEFLYSGGKFTTLPVPAGDTGVSAAAINNSGQIAGSIFPSGSASHAALFTNGAWQDLGAISGAISTAATGVNSTGQVVGFGRLPDTGKYPRRIPGKRVPFIYRNGTLVDLNTLIPAGSGYTLGGNMNQAVSINDSGQILCLAFTPAGTQHAVLLTPVANP